MTDAHKALSELDTILRGLTQAPLVEVDNIARPGEQPEIPRYGCRGTWWEPQNEGEKNMRAISLNGRAQNTVIAILKILDAAEQEPNLDPRELRFRLWQFVRGDYADLALQMTCEQETAEPSTYDMGPTSAIPNVNGLTFEETKDAIVSWFFDNFEDPAEITPYESAEGGYQFIWGGPYDAREQVDAAFASVTSEDVIDAAAEQIEHDGCEWAPSQSRMVEERD